ncbi:hypothetical protein PR048_031344 [Dryococelus australis]|uniref:Uncharacterized protein n=1 Tax=Dryococelus australis TaxID=614101 RepID=A0ABQ9G643_9NEOP|nr:hypothetical protein PR048_031344 [Dryococelus australis]
MLQATQSATIDVVLSLRLSPQERFSALDATKRGSDKRQHWHAHHVRHRTKRAVFPSHCVSESYILRYSALKTVDFIFLSLAILEYSEMVLLTCEAFEKYSTAVRGEYGAAGGKRESPEKTRRLAASSGTVPTRNSEECLSGLAHGSHCNSAGCLPDERLTDRFVNTGAKRTTGDSATHRSGTGMKGRGKREIPEKTRRPTALSGTIPTCKNPVTQPGIEPGSSWCTNLINLKSILPCNLSVYAAQQEHFTPVQHSALRLVAMAHLISVAESPLSLPHFSASKVQNSSRQTTPFPPSHPITTTHLPPRKTGLDFQRDRSQISHAGISAGFLGDLRFPPPFHSGAAPYSSSSSTLNTSKLRAIQISSFTHSQMIKQLLQPMKKRRRLRYVQYCEVQPDAKQCHEFCISLLIGNFCSLGASNWQPKWHCCFAGSLTHAFTGAATSACLFTSLSELMCEVGSLKTQGIFFFSRERPDAGPVRTARLDAIGPDARMCEPGARDKNVPRFLPSDGKEENKEEKELNYVTEIQMLPPPPPPPPASALFPWIRKLYKYSPANGIRLRGRRTILSAEPRRHRSGNLPPSPPRPFTKRHVSEDPRFFCPAPPTRRIIFRIQILLAADR